MRKIDIKEYINKKIQIVVKTGYFYTGTIIELFEDHLVFIDKFDSRMKISYDTIASVSEKRNGGSQ